MWDPTKVAQAAAEIKRIGFFVDRIVAQRQALAFATRTRMAAPALHVQLLDRYRELTYTDFSFMDAALAVVERGREVALWSYVHAFYITDKRYQALFEYSQVRRTCHPALARHPYESCKPRRLIVAPFRRLSWSSRWSFCTSCWRMITC